MPKRIAHQSGNYRRKLSVWGGGIAYLTVVVVAVIAAVICRWATPPVPSEPELPVVNWQAVKSETMPVRVADTCPDPQPVGTLCIASIVRAAPIVTAVPIAGNLPVPADGTAVTKYSATSSLTDSAENIIIAGHVTYLGKPGPLYGLDTLRPGQIAQIRETSGKTRKWVARSVTTVTARSVELAQLLAPTSSSRLTVVTCTGKWTGTHYSHNLVAIFEPLAHHS